ncbi:MAG: alpha/beta fold hydrolase [Pseudomonadota bacterium]
MIPPILRSSKQTWNRLSQIAPARAGDLAYQRFCTPLLSESRTPDHSKLVERARRHLRHAEHHMLLTCEGWVRVYTFEPLKRDDCDCNGLSTADAFRPKNGRDTEVQDPKTVILVHGWTSEASFMAAIAEALRRAGFRVILFDFPAHGLSPGTHTNIICCARVFIDVVDNFGPVDYALSHSMGGWSTLLAAGGDKPYKRACVLDGYVFIATPNDFRATTSQFSKSLGLTKTAHRHYERHLERVAHQDLSKLSTANYLNMIGKKALFLHSRDDQEISVTNAEEVDAACSKATFISVDGLGHRRILYASNVTRHATKFLHELSSGQARQSVVQRATKAKPQIEPAVGLSGQA